MNTLPMGGFEVALATPVAALLAAAALLAIARILYRQQRTESTQRAQGWRIALLVLAQPVCAALLYLALFPPAGTPASGEMVVATAGATGAQLDDADAPGAVHVALPEAPALAGVARVPDLATALRRHPDVQRIHVVGTGLEARDREAARDFELQFSPAALPRGVVELEHAARIAAGDEFSLAGRAEGTSGGSAELLDPAGRRVDRAAVDGKGRFVLSATTRVPGVATYSLRLSDAQQQAVDELELPLQVEAPTPPRVLLLAGAPNPEVKYLRRWARDAGLPLHTQIAAGGGLQLGDAPLTLDTADLARFDVVVLDERAWSALGDAQRGALGEAMRDGLGVLLRVTAALSETERRRLAAWGFEVDAGRDAAPVRLALRKRDDATERARLGPGTRDAPRAADAVVADVPALTRRTLRIRAPDALPLLADDAGAPLATWRASGRGRIALWPLTDSYRLVLAGRDDLHGELWSRALGTVARAQPQRSIEVPPEAWQGERVTVCGLGDESRVTSRDGVETELLRDPATGTGACAGYWPRETGWHRLQSGDREQLFHVRARDSAPGLRAADMREATLQLVAVSPRRGLPTATSSSAPDRPGPRWPWWLAWLVASAALWWLERSRAGRS